MPNLVPVEWALLSFVSVKPTHCPVLLGPLFGLSPAVGGRATIHPRCIAALTGLAEVALADATAVPIETLVAAASAEGAALILNRFGKPRTATQIAAIVLSLVRHRPTRWSIDGGAPLSIEVRPLARPRRKECAALCMCVSPSARRIFPRPSRVAFSEQIVVK